MWWTNYLGEAATGLIAGVAGWLFSRRQKAAEADKAEGSALAEMQKSYVSLTKHMNEKFKDMQAEIDKLHAENKALREEIKNLRRS